MSFLFPRKIEIRRETSTSDPTPTTVPIGAQAYLGTVNNAASGGTTETVIYPMPSKAMCSIQSSESGGRAAIGGVLPDNLSTLPRYRIFIPQNVIAKGVIRDRDIVIDDEAYRYQVTSAYWDSLGYELMTVRLNS